MIADKSATYLRDRTPSLFYRLSMTSSGLGKLEVPCDSLQLPCGAWRLGVGLRFGFFLGLRV